MIVYLVAPLKKDKEHTVEQHRILAEMYVKEFMKVYPEHIVIVPHLMFPSADEKRDREEILQFELDILPLCGGIAVAGDQISEGMSGEISQAEYFNLKIFWQDSKLEKLWEAEND